MEDDFHLDMKFCEDDKRKIELKNYKSELDELISVETNDDAKELYLHIQSLFEIINDSDKYIVNLKLKLKEYEEENILLKNELKKFREKGMD